MSVNFFTGRAAFSQYILGTIPLAVGSGFFVRWGAMPVFVTARHNLTGRHWLTHDTLRDDGRTPDRISINVPIVEDASSGGRFGFQEVIVELEQDYKPIWKELPHRNGVCDFAAIPVDGSWEAAFIERWKARHSIEGSFKVACINDGDDWFDSANRQLKVGAQAFVLGFPFGIAAGAPNRPIWRGGNVATEPAGDFDGWPIFLVDASGRKGMSGAPVVVRDDSGLLRFSGIYSGRILKEKDNSELGYVWKAPKILELLSKAYGVQRQPND